jgi:hypothetical protein
MPEKLPVVLGIIGGVLLLIALLGGRFKVFGAEVLGTVKRPIRWMAGIASVFLIGAAVYLAQGERPAKDGGTGTGTTVGTPVQEPPQPPPMHSDEVFIQIARRPPDERLLQALILALGGRDIEQARKLSAEAGRPDGFTVVVPMRDFEMGGGTPAHLESIEQRLAKIRVRVERQR